MYSMKKKPKYQLIVDDLKEKINSGKFDPALPFPTHIELTHIYNTSEITTRRALTELVNEGIIYRTQKKGTFLKLDEDKMIKSKKINKVNRIYFVYHVDDIKNFDHRFLNDLLEGLESTCSENGIQCSMWDIGDHFNLPEGEHNGLILLPCFPNAMEIPIEVLKKWKSEGRDLVTIEYYYPHLQIPYVIADNLTGGYLATEHLLTLGHQRVAILLTGKSYLEMNQEFSLRLQGYKLALAQHQIDFDSELVCVIDGSWEHEEMGYKGFRQLMNIKNPPTAIFTTTDYKAIGAMKAAKEMGLNIPDDVSIVGYDDIRVGHFTLPTLTTLNQNSFQIGKKAVELLIFEHNRENMRDEIVPELIIRESTKAPKMVEKR